MIELTELKKQYDFKVKIILVGGPETGKSAYLNRLIYNEFSLIKENSIGIEIGTRFFESTAYSYKSDLWDACGSEKSLMYHEVFLDNSVGMFN